MKRIQSVISFLLALTMVCNMLPVPGARAEETESQTETSEVSSEVQEEFFSDTLMANVTIQGTVKYITDDVLRIYGDNRYETSLKVAECLLAILRVEQFENIVVASGTNFPDALSGAYLAIQREAPILLVNKRYVDKVNQYIQKRLKPGGTVYLLGGSSAVPDSVGSGIGGISVKRLGGANRYETNLEILKETGVAGQNILICTGKGFADSLSASATGVPILLVKDTLNDAQKAILSQNKGTKFIIGGESAVSASIEKELKAYGEVERIGGSNRYQTSVMVAERTGCDMDAAMLAYAKNFPDGLCGGPLAYYLDVPMILTATGKESAAVLFAYIYDTRSGYVLGGDGLISDQTAICIFEDAPEVTEPTPTEPEVTEPEETEPKYTMPVQKPSQSSNSVVSIIKSIFGRPLTEEYIADRYETRYTYYSETEPKDEFDALQSKMESLGLNVYRHSFSSNGGRKELVVKAAGGSPVTAKWYKKSGEIVVTIKWEYVRKAGIFDGSDIPEEQKPEPTTSNPGDKVRCNVCFGDGKCPKCGGTGEVTEWVSGTVRDYVTQTCNRCWGTKKCDSCDDGWVDG